MATGMVLARASSQRAPDQRPGAGVTTPAARRAWVAGVVAAYALASWLIALPLGPVPSGHLPTCACADVAQEVWLLALASVHPFAFHTGLIDVPRGVGLFDNASFPLVGTVAAPLTRAVGPVAALTVLLRVSFLLSAVAAFAALRWVRLGVAGAAVGGALYAFSPFMTHQGASHFFLVLGPLPPLMLALLVRALRGWEQRTWAAGAGVGLLGAAQFFVDSEVLIMAAVAAAVAVVLWLAWRFSRGTAAGAWRRAVVVAGASVLSAAPFLVYPAWVALTGPDRLVGPTQPNAGGVGVAATFFPGDRGIVAGLWRAWRVPVGQYLGHNSYLGVVLVAACVAVAVRQWRDPLVRAAGGFAVVAWVLSLGGHLTWTVAPTGVPLPFAVLQHLPVLQDIIPNRFSEFVDLGLAAVIAAGVDGLAARWRSPSARRLADLGLAVLLVAGLALAAPDRGYGSRPVGAAASFAPPSTAWSAVPAGSVVLAYPIPQFPEDQAMLWQAESGLRFRLVGGYAIRPGPGRRSDRLPLLPPPAALPRALVGALERPGSLAVGSPAWDRAGRELRPFLRAERVRAVVVERQAPGGPAVAALVRRHLGPALARAGGLELWLVRAPGRAGNPGR